MIKSILKVGAALSVAVILASCASSKPGAGAEEEAGPQVLDGSVEELSERAQKLEKENHELRKQIFEMRRELGLPQEETPAAESAK